MTRSGHGSYSQVTLPTSLLVLLPAIALVLTAVVLGVYLHEFNGPLSAESHAWGQFGEFLGGVLGPVFGFLSFIAVLLTIALQRDDIRHSKQSFESTLAAMRHQNALLEMQAFEGTFFKLLERCSRLVDSTQFQSTVGREALRLLYTNSLCRYFSDITQQRAGNAAARKQAYDRFYSDQSHHIHHFFKSIFNILHFIQTSSLPVDAKNKYVEILRAQMSTFELRFLHYECAFGHKNLTGCNLIRQSGLISDVDRSELFFPEEEIN